MIFNDLNNSDNYRLINADGTFNINRRGKSEVNIYEVVLAMPWNKIIFSFLIIYFMFNCAFGLLFMALGSENIRGAQKGTWLEMYTQMICFSIYTFMTVGFGDLSLQGNAANLLSAFVGLFLFALSIGLSFSKFSKLKAYVF